MRRSPTDRENVIVEGERRTGRTLLGVGAWVSTLAGVAMLTRGWLAPVLLSVAIVVFIAVARAVAFARARVERLRSWPRPGEIEYPAGPRRVPLLETGLAGPERG